MRTRPTTSRLAVLVFVAGLLLLCWGIATFLGSLGMDIHFTGWR